MKISREILWACLGIQAIGVVACVEEVSTHALQHDADMNAGSECQAGQVQCTSDESWAICLPSGTLGAAHDCGDGMLCHPESGTCAFPQCVAGQVTCADLWSLKRCDPHGISWLPTTEACAEGHLCYENTCILESCIPIVMLMVDRSGSMKTEWDEVSQGVHSLVADHPQAITGLLDFPHDGAGCTVSGTPDIPPGLHDAQEFDDWFQSNIPGYGTPLITALNAFKESAGKIYHGYGGALILLSDGADSCDLPTNEALGAITEALLVDLGIITYVIGYAYDGDVAPLDAIAAAGGSGFDVHIPAGNEAELTEAFKGAISDFKLCVPTR